MLRNMGRDDANHSGTLKCSAMGNASISRLVMSHYPVSGCLAYCPAEEEAVSMGAISWKWETKNPGKPDSTKGGYLHE